MSGVNANNVGAICPCSRNPTWSVEFELERKRKMKTTHTDFHSEPVRSKLLELLDEVLLHDGFGDIRVEVKILKRRQKEVILHCGKQYRFVVDAPGEQ
jgi:hypothetical protein